jgi:hypothetical protein
VPARGENFHPLGFARGWRARQSAPDAFLGRPLYSFWSAAILLGIPSRMSERSSDLI